MLEDFLTLTGSVVTVVKKVDTPDGMGGVTTTSIITGLPKAIIYGNTLMGLGQHRKYLSDRIVNISSDILVTLPSYYTFGIQDIEVIYDSKTYKIKGMDNVMNLGEIMVVGLERYDGN
jgi:hypothetical protein